MAHFTLHYILFSVIKLINPHMLLTESFSLIWSSSQEEKFGLNQTPPSINDRILDEQKPDGMNYTELLSSNDSKFLYTYLSIYLISITAFIGSCLISPKCVDQRNNHRDLINSFGLGILFKIIYIYIINTLANSDIELFPLSLRIFHSVVLIALIIGFQWTHLKIGAISDTLALDYSVQHSKPLGVHYNFIIYLIFGTFGLAIMSICLSEGYLIRTFLFESGNLRFTNIVITITLICFTLEFIYLLIFTNKQEIDDISFKISLEKFSRRNLKFFSSYPTHYSATTKEFYSLNDNSAKFPTSLLNQVQMFNAVDEDEVDLFYIHSISSSKNTNVQENIAFQNTEDAFDRNKYSLYEDFCFKSNQNFSLNSRIESSHVKTCFTENMDNGRRFNDMSVLEILLTGDSELTMKVVALSVIGAFYQTNQLCILSEYITYIIDESPNEFEDFISGIANQLLSSKDLKYEIRSYKTSAKPCIIWIELFCLSYLVQCLARIFCLHYVHSLITRYGIKNSLNGLLIACPMLIIQLALNYHLLRNRILNLSHQYLIIVVICQLMIIQIQIGLLSALIDYIINDLTLQISQLVRNLRAVSSGTKTKESNDESVRCTVNGILSASFLHIGSALMTASMLLHVLYVSNISGRKQSGKHPGGSIKVSILLSIIPVSSLLICTTVLYLKRRRLINRKMM